MPANSEHLLPDTDLILISDLQDSTDLRSNADQDPHITDTKNPSSNKGVRFEVQLPVFD
jgi:hypothetical protein